MLVKRVISAACFVLFIVLLISGMLIALGVGIGFLLSALLPGVDLAAGIVAGAIFLLVIVNVFSRIAAVIIRQYDDDVGDAEDENEGEDEDDEEDEDFEADADSYFNPPPGTFHHRRKSKRKKLR